MGGGFVFLCSFPSDISLYYSVPANSLDVVSFYNKEPKKKATKIRHEKKKKKEKNKTKEFFSNKTREGEDGGIKNLKCEDGKSEKKKKQRFLGVFWGFFKSKLDGDEETKGQSTQKVSLKSWNKDGRTKKKKKGDGFMKNWNER